MRTLGRLICMMGLWCYGFAQAGSVAVAVDIQGKVFRQTSQEASSRLNVLDYLADQAVLQVDKGGEAHVVSLKNSTSWVLKGPGQYRIGVDAIQTLQGKPPVLKKSERNSSGLLAMESSQRERLALGAVVMRGNATPVRLLAPIDGPVLDYRPSLYWEAREPVKLVVVEKESGHTVTQIELRKSEFQFPQALKPGVYAWRVSPLDDGSRASIGEFEIMGAQDPRRALIKTPPSRRFAQRLQRAVELQQAGFEADAWVLWKALSEERPEDENLKVWAR